MYRDIEKKINNRLKRIEGQVRGIGSMVDKNTEYTKILTQISAATSALKSVQNILLEHRLENTISKLDKESAQELIKIFNIRK